MPDKTRSPTSCKYDGLGDWEDISHSRNQFQRERYLKAKD